MALRWEWWLLPVLAVLLLAAYGSLSLQVGSATHIFLELAPKLGMALLVLFAARMGIELVLQVAGNMVRPPELRRTVRDIAALFIWPAAALAVLAVFIGDLSALLIATGFICVGLAFALRKPILSLVGWLTIVSDRAYRPGDLISVAGVEGDVLSVGLLTTTLRATGSGEGKTVLLPNMLILSEPVANYTRDFPYVWDEVSFPIPQGASVPGLKQILLHACDEVIGNRKMVENAKEYSRLLQASGVSVRRSAPEIAFSIAGGETSITLKYIVQARQRASTKSALSERIFEALSVQAGKQK